MLGVAAAPAGAVALLLRWAVQPAWTRGFLPEGALVSAPARVALTVTFCSLLAAVATQQRRSRAAEECA